MPNAIQMREGTVQRLAVDDLATIYGCCGLFDLCADEDLMSLHFQGADPFLDWLGWQGTLDCLIMREFIAWMRPEYSQGVRTVGYLDNPCDDPNEVEWGKCDFCLEDFARLRREGPVRDVTYNDVRYCFKQPRYRLDGTMINDDREYDARVITEVILQDFRRMLVTGNAVTGGQFNGLQQLVATGYTNTSGGACQMMDSIVVDWNSNGVAGGAGITWNGNAVAATYNLVDVILAVFRRIVQRIKWSPVLGAQGLQVGDIVLVLPTFLTRCLLDAYTCWSVCNGSQYNEVAIQSYEARTFRNNLNGGMFQAGRIWLDGFEIPLIAYDWELINGPTRGDMYMLTGQIGNVKTLHGEFLNMSTVPGAYPDTGYFYTDGGRLLWWTERDHTCVKQVGEFRPRLVSWAPWSNARFQNVRCDIPGGPLSPDPAETSFFPMSSFSIAECPEPPC